MVGPHVKELCRKTFKKDIQSWFNVVVNDIFKSKKPNPIFMTTEAKTVNLDHLTQSQKPHYSTGPFPANSMHICHSSLTLNFWLSQIINSYKIYTKIYLYWYNKLYFYTRLFMWFFRLGFTSNDLWTTFDNVNYMYKLYMQAPKGLVSKTGEPLNKGTIYLRRQALLWL